MSDPRSALKSWSQQFREHLRTWSTTGRGPYSVRSPTLDELVAGLPLEGEQDEQMNELHRVAMKAVVARHVAFLSADLEVGLQRSGSPIERVMLYALYLVGYEYTDSVSIVVDGTGHGGSQSTWGIEIEPQAEIGRYRVDFLLRRWNSAESAARNPSPSADAALIVECDGHEWHERTKQQAARDRKRDRMLQSQGYRVFRYTGSEIWRDVFLAAEEAVSVL
jgi:very-short-patch-repair endonuclease